MMGQCMVFCIFVSQVPYELDSMHCSCCSVVREAPPTLSEAPAGFAAVSKSVNIPLASSGNLDNLHAYAYVERVDSSEHSTC